MKRKQPSANEQGQLVDPTLPLLRQLSPHQLAKMIRDLDSQLVGIESKQYGDQLTLLYCFVVAGNVQRFPICVTDQPMPSIGDLYPDACAFEAELQRKFGLVFQSADDNASTPSLH